MMLMTPSSERNLCARSVDDGIKEKMSVLGAQDLKEVSEDKENF